jgi:Predicted nucleotide-binding protein containing TIR-like domain
MANRPGRQQKPRVFVGSSSEANPVVKALIKKLSRVAHMVPWWESPEFKPMTSVLSGLLEAVDEGVSKYDFGLFVLTPDDVIRSRQRQSRTPRDNVLFELGLFLGSFGPKRTFATLQLETKNVDKVKVPSDFHGIIIPTFTAPKNRTFDHTIEKVAKQFKDFIRDGPRPIREKLVYWEGLLWDFDWKDKKSVLTISAEFLRRNEVVLRGKRLLLVSLVTDAGKNVDQNQNIALSLPRDVPQILEDMKLWAPDKRAGKNIFSRIKPGAEVQARLFVIPSDLKISKGITIKDLLDRGAETAIGAAVAARRSN